MQESHVSLLRHILFSSGTVVGNMKVQGLQRKTKDSMNTSHSLFCDHCGAANASQATVCFACHQPLHAPPPAQATQTHAQAQVSAGQAALVSLSPATPSVPASRLNLRYHIISEIGQGGFGRVYKAQDSQNKNKLVAIKQINLHSLSPREIIEATDTYNREVSLLSTLKHANLPCIYDHFTDPEHWYLVMDFIEGETLEAYLQKAKKGYLQVREVLTIGIHLCTVLDYLHTQKPPIIFRDVKPANIMRTPRGHLYLIDFGIARHFTLGQTKDTEPLGSPGYAAPEQYGKAQTTVQTDIYGLGATLQTLLTGADPLETAGGGTSSTPTRRIPKKLHQLLNQMREPDASQRPKSMDEVKCCLQLIKWGIAKSILTTIRPLHPFFWGLLIGSMPYSFIIPCILLAALYGTDNLVLFISRSYFLLLLTCVVFLAQLIVGIRFLFSPGKRLMGLGILAMQVFLLIGIIWTWIPSPLPHF